MTSIHPAQLTLPRIFCMRTTSTSDEVHTRTHSTSPALGCQVSSHSVPQSTDFKSCLKMRKGQSKWQQGTVTVIKQKQVVRETESSLLPGGKVLAELCAGTQLPPCPSKELAVTEFPFTKNNVQSSMAVWRQKARYLTIKGTNDTRISQHSVFPI